MAAIGGFPGQDNSHELSVYLRAASAPRPTDEMRAAVRRRMGVADGVELDPWMEAAIWDVLAIAARDREMRQRAAGEGDER